MSRRKSIVVDDGIFGQRESIVEPLRLESLILRTDKYTSYFDQLNYRFAPNYSNKGNGQKRNNVEYAPMGRESFVREMYKLFEPKWGLTTQKYLVELRKYIRWLDESDLTDINDDYFHPELYTAYMQYYQGQVNRGERKKSSWGKARSMLTFILKEKGREHEAKVKLPKIKGTKKNTDSHKGIDLKEEFRPLIKVFFSAFAKFVKHLKEGSSPNVHPFWNESLFNKTADDEGWSSLAKRKNKITFKRAVKNGYGIFSFYNHFSRLATMLTFCLTGQNTSPILNLRFGDIRFATRMNGKVYFDMNKARANYLGFDTSLGFKPHVQAFFNQWLEVSQSLQIESGTDWLFPYFSESGTVKSFIEAGQSTPQKHINQLTKLLGLAHINPSKLRQTKIDTLMKVTEDIWLVSMSANNSVSVIAASYGSGHETDHRNNIAASHTAMFDFAQGVKSIHDAVNEAKYEFSDVLSNYDYKRLRDTENDRQTPIGTRCKDAKQGKAKSIKKNLELNGIDLPEDVCTDFLGCFECSHHRLVAEVEDIWLMLSFNDTLDEMKGYPSINSLPTDKFHRLCNTIASILRRFSEVSPENYAEASEMHREAPHPLYSDAYSLIDLLETF
ncbi:Core-binding (CB) domain-containing protein [Vibrio crassostreae]|uniref:hypothetical protein n=1 Tax=Vibrio TaxID=662 RepID=UPI0009761A12|nr:hypothetical protein [Vibrio splendidus]CAK1917764.1 Core-binding (CB) domain-containing protein [Vibrio crassostreae]OMO28188.1 hypothetical protein BH581_11260 [Vibrio splendidus]CAK1919479.1 Core-binding (CB) domain-containing protein [Vibrio crassostreae]CAK1938224.1 Core-binding (CB) domain-containing protein [Vibrio crassostreae]CAK1941447.1 Core-binding (CB) domain-containing protein [Vibrio crassostreae]